MSIKEGFYYLQGVDEDEPTLVHGYHCTDMGGKFVFGFNTYDGGGLIPFDDISEGTMIMPVTIFKGGVDNALIEHGGE